MEETIKIRSETNKIETKTMQRTNETKSWFFGSISKIDKPLVNLTKRRRGITQINNIRDEKGVIATNIIEI
jgi:hypothetical protein